jgi:hypothetical protein
MSRPFRTTSSSHGRGEQRSGEDPPLAFLNGVVPLVDSYSAAVATLEEASRPRCGKDFCNFAPPVIARIIAHYAWKWGVSVQIFQLLTPSAIESPRGASATMRPSRSRAQSLPLLHLIILNQLVKELAPAPNLRRRTSAHFSISIDARGWTSLVHFSQAKKDFSKLFVESGCLWFAKQGESRTTRRMGGAFACHLAVVGGRLQTASNITTSYGITSMMSLGPLDSAYLPRSLFPQRECTSHAPARSCALYGRALLLAAGAACWLLPTAGRAQEARPTEAGWISLFNGKDLDGWKVKIKGSELDDNSSETFRAENGVLKVAYDQYQSFDNRFGHIFYKEKFSHYRLRIEYRFVGEQCAGGPAWAKRNSGVMVHSQSPESMAKDQDFPVSIEVQFLGGLGQGERPTGNLCTPGTHVVMNGELVKRHCTNSKSKTYHGDQWVTAEVEVQGGKLIKHLINGEQVLSYERPQLDDSDANARKLIKEGGTLLSEGYIALQAESHPIEFRKVELLPLKE